MSKLTKIIKSPNEIYLYAHKEDFCVPLSEVSIEQLEDVISGFYSLMKKNIDSIEEINQARSYLQASFGKRKLSELQQALNLYAKYEISFGNEMAINISSIRFYGWLFKKYDQYALNKRQRLPKTSSPDEMELDPDEVEKECKQACIDDFKYFIETKKHRHTIRYPVHYNYIIKNIECISEEAVDFMKENRDKHVAEAKEEIKSKRDSIKNKPDKLSNIRSLLKTFDTNKKYTANRELRTIQVKALFEWLEFAGEEINFK